VRIPLTELTDGPEVRGTMVGEMGFGNTPLDIVPFVNACDGTSNVLVTSANRSAVSINPEAVAAADAMPHGEGVQNVFSVEGVFQFPLPMSGTLPRDDRGRDAGTSDDIGTVGQNSAPDVLNVMFDPAG